MVPETTSLRVVRVIPGQTTGGDDDTLVAEDGSRWKRVSASQVDATAPASTAILRNGRIER